MVERVRELARVDSCQHAVLGPADGVRSAAAVVVAVEAAKIAFAGV